jgi:hypothetical protein
MERERARSACVYMEYIFEKLINNDTIRKKNKYKCERYRTRDSLIAFFLGNIMDLNWFTT